MNRRGGWKVKRREKLRVGREKEGERKEEGGGIEG